MMSNDAEFNNFITPAVVDTTLRQAIQFCWLLLPKDRRNPDEVKRMVVSKLERALRDFGEDYEDFGAETKKQ